MQTLKTSLTTSGFKKPDMTPEEWAENDAMVAELEAEQARADMQTRINRAGIPRTYRAAEISSADVKEWSNNPTKGLLLQGEVGRGKTHNACAALLEAIKNGMTAKFTTFDDLIRECKASFQGMETEKAIIGRYANTGMLCIDDMGKERVTEWSLPILFAIINKRSMEGRPTIITTNYTGRQLIERMTINGDDETARAIVSRLCEYRVVKIEGRDWRRDNQ